MNLLPGIEDDSTAAALPSSRETPNSGAALTIFYGGKVIVFDDFPAEKAEQVMAMASRDRQNLPNRATYPKPLEPSHNSDLPIARRGSLHRFLEKRKDRISAMAPYPAQASKGEERRQWLGLKPLP